MSRRGLNPDSPPQIHSSAETADNPIILRIQGSTGSSWSTPAERLSHGWPEAKPPTNIFQISPGTRPATFESRISFGSAEVQHGEQAGIYAWKDEMNWVKFVVEGTGADGGLQLIFAEQARGEPFVRGKILLPKDEIDSGIRLKMEVLDDSGGAGSVVAFWKLGFNSAEVKSATPMSVWSEMQRGLSWLTDDDGTNTIDAIGRDKSKDIVACALPVEWTAVLLTEQWQTPTVVTFCDVVVG